MNPRELRIGNFINYSDYGPSVITKVDGDGFCSFVPYRWSGDIGKMLSEIDPIPLTEEWLIKFGFTGDVNSGFGKDAIELNYITTDEHFEFEYKTSSKAWMLVPIKFVHQLQNLYFALSGEELTISEPTKQ